MSYICKVIPAPAGTTSTNVVYIPDLGGTVVDLNSTQTLTNKTLTNAVLSSTNAVLTTPTITGAVNATLTTPTLTNATITGATMNGILTITNATLFTPSMTQLVASKAATGSNIATANATTGYGFCLVTGANGTAGVQLPVGSAQILTIKNSESAAAALKVYPPTGGQINEGGANNSITMAANSCADFFGFNTTHWYSNPKVPS